MPVFTRDDQRLLFVHIPKAGGTSVENHFAAHGFDIGMLERRAPGRVGSVRRYSPQHYHASLLREVLWLERLDLIFTVVRDPLDRFRSEYAWRHRAALSAGTETARPEDIEAWGLRTLDRMAREPGHLDNHLRPQVEFLLPGTVVLRLEDGLDVAMRRLREEHGVAIGDEIAHANKRAGHAGKRTEVPLTDRLRAALAAVYDADCERLGYPAISRG